MGNYRILVLYWVYLKYLMKALLLYLLSLSFDQPVQFVVNHEEFVADHVLISRDIHGLISVTKDSVYMRLDSAYASFKTFKFNSTRKILTASFRNRTTYGDIYGLSKIVYVSFYDPKYGHVQVKYRVKHTTLED